MTKKVNIGIFESDIEKVSPQVRERTMMLLLISCGVFYFPKKEMIFDEKKDFYYCRYLIYFVSFRF